MMICVECRRTMTVLENGVVVVDGTVDDNHSVCEGDLIGCETCDKQVITNFGKAHFMTTAELMRAGEFKLVLRLTSNEPVTTS